MNKRKLYERIMRSVSREVSKTLNEMAMRVDQNVKVGNTIHINYMDDNGGKDVQVRRMTDKEGVVLHIDGIGQLHGTWGSLAVNPEMDSFEIVMKSWGNDEMDDNADETGAIGLTLSQTIAGGHDSVSSEWMLMPLEDCGSYWKVKATCIDSDWRRFRKGDEIEYEIEKDGVSVFDFEYDLLRELENNDY